MASSSSQHLSLNTLVGHLTDEVAAIVGALVGGAKYGIKIRLPHAVVMTVLFRRDLTSKEKLQSIVRMVFEHASNLAAFATIYKTILAALKFSSRSLRQQQQQLQQDPQYSTNNNNQRAWGRYLLRLIVDGPFSVGTQNNNSNNNTGPSLAKAAGYPERPYHALIAGATGGYLIWGQSSSINHQIILYLTSRVIVGLANRAWEHIYGTPHHHPTSLLQHPKTYPLLAATVWAVVMVLFESSPHVLHRSLRASMDEIYRYELPSKSSDSVGPDDKKRKGPLVM